MRVLCRIRGRSGYMVTDKKIPQTLAGYGFMYWRATVGLEPTTHSLGNCRLTVQRRETLIRLDY